ncbi:hypothetical protein EMCRGX_G008667 [Ephydatia muelleri]
MVTLSPASKQQKTQPHLTGWYVPIVPEVYNHIHQMWNINQRRSFDFLSTRRKWKRKGGNFSFQTNP